MMIQDIQLKELQQKVIRKRTLLKELSVLQLQQQELASKVKDLEQKKQAEQKDVDRLEKGGIGAFFYSMIGKKEEKLEKERAEAAEASRQYEEVHLEFQRVNRSMELKETELAALDDYEEKFIKMLEGKRRLLENSGLESELEILKAERELGILKERGAMLSETDKLGTQILEYIAQVQETLSEAERAAISQTSASIGLDIMKANLLSKAQKQVAMLQPVLSEFRSRIEIIYEGKRITDHLDVVYQFGNGIYTSYIASESVMDVVSIERIRTAKGNLMLLRERMQDIMPQLKVEKESVEKKKTIVEERLENLIVNA